jgi:hypothetical protein
MLTVLALLLNARLDRDGGPIYTETDLSKTIVEPWNAGSALLFIGIVAYWAWQLRGRLNQFTFLAWCLPILLIGGIGGTIYHAFRIHMVWLVMDFMPILILCLASSIYLWRYALPKKLFWFVVPPFILLSFVSRFLLMRLGLPMPIIINSGYALLALTIVVPVVLVLVRTNWRNGGWIASAFVAFVLAVGFRLVDPEAWLPFGTHWLWHVFGAVSAHSMIGYLYAFKQDKLTLAANSVPQPAMA